MKKHPGLCRCLSLSDSAKLVQAFISRRLDYSNALQLASLPGGRSPSLGPTGQCHHWAVPPLHTERGYCQPSASSRGWSRHFCLLDRSRKQSAAVASFNEHSAQSALLEPPSPRLQSAAGALRPSPRFVPAEEPLAFHRRLWAAPGERLLLTAFPVLPLLAARCRQRSCLHHRVKLFWHSRPNTSVNALLMCKTGWETTARNLLLPGKVQNAASTLRQQPQLGAPGPATLPCVYPRREKHSKQRLTPSHLVCRAHSPRRAAHPTHTGQAPSTH